jgi:hypothetical protein
MKETYTVEQMADEFILWDNGVNMDTFDLFRVAAKAWSLSQEQQDALVLELDRRGII